MSNNKAEAAYHPHLSYSPNEVDHPGMKSMPWPWGSKQKLRRATYEKSPAQRFRRGYTPAVLLAFCIALLAGGVGYFLALVIGS